MKLIHKLPDTSLFQKPSLITIGNFDGMHLGHQALIRNLVKTAKNHAKPAVVLSFENHPIEVLRPEIEVHKICTLAHKVKLMEEMGVDLLVLLTFTKEFSEQTAEVFIQHLQQSIPFSDLLLGWDATIGKDRKGNRETIQELAKKHHFDVHYLDQQKIDEIPVSSSMVRRFIQEGDLNRVQQLLGRPYSIYSAVYKGEGKGKHLGFPTANIHVKGLCFPPLGVYAVEIRINNQLFHGVANLGIAPTMREDKVPVLEVHIFDLDRDLYNQELEVIFLSYLRSEKKFSGIEELKAQIQQDIVKAKSFI